MSHTALKVSSHWYPNSMHTCITTDHTTIKPESKLKKHIRRDNGRLIFPQQLHVYKANNEVMPVYTSVSILNHNYSTQLEQILHWLSSLQIFERIISYRFIKPVTLYTHKKKTPWFLVRKRTIPTELPSLIGEFWWQLLRLEGCRVVNAAVPYCR
jgi:hypothetical protein